MDKIKIKCTCGITLPLNEMCLYAGKLKKHSLIEIERLVDSISEDGFLFPIAVGKIKDKNYIVDGECRFYALQELKNRGYEIPEIPVFYVKSSEETIIKNILLGTSTNHCVTETSLKKFVENTNMENQLLDFAFNDNKLIDFHTIYDLDLYVDNTDEVINSNTLKKEDFEGLLK